MSVYAAEQTVAIAAVQRACALTRAVFADLILNKPKDGSITKEDKSPVTVADFGAQAIVNAMLAKHFPNDAVVGEEDSEALQSNSVMRGQVWALVQKALSSFGDASLITDEAAMLKMIDRGMYEGGAKGRMWVLDPIDGTKGFLRGGQYAVCLALLVDARVVLGVIGCPNLAPNVSAAQAAAAMAERGPAAAGISGLIMWAEAGQGAFASSVHDAPANAERVHVSAANSDPASLRFCESVEAGHSDQSINSRIAARLGIGRPPTRMDSQAKYASVARGDGDIYLRLPISATYQEKIWDHASGNVIVHEAGGVVTDIFGKPLDFGLGRTLRHNKGIVAAPKALFPSVIEAVKAEWAAAHPE